MIIKSAEYIKSTVDINNCPPQIYPEYAFIGRSNVGKSSLINLLTSRKRLAKISVTPGKTRTINHFLINNEWYLVDLPGLGYAKISKTSRKAWESMVTDYLLYRRSLLNIFLLIDMRLSPQKIDIKFLEWIGNNHLSFSIVFTKADKLSLNDLNTNLNNYKTFLLESWESLPDIFITSSRSGKGKDDILNYIEKTNKIFNPDEHQS
ncbi:ribosome biogenesis GTP-binding protein YihA/YsxC [Bacteroidota bacterium]